MSGYAIVGHLGEWVFNIFPRLHSNVGGAPLYFLEFLWIMLQYSNTQLFVTKHK